MRTPMLFVAVAFAATAVAFCQSAANVVQSGSSDEVAIQQIEEDFLRAERTTDPAVLEKILADDFAQLGTNRSAPGKSELLKNWQSRAGQAPPYNVEESDMRIVVRGDTAVASYTKTYTAKENGNVAHQDNTDIFTRLRGAWKLRVSRFTFCQK